MNEFNFKSQPATSIEQSKRLLALGIKKETADMCYQIAYWDCGLLKECSPSLIPHNIIDGDRFIPAWSLDRLRKLLPVYIPIEDDYGEEWNAVIAFYQKRVIIESEPYWAKGFDKDNLYDNIIDCIEWLIKEGYFNKEYLEE